MQTPECRTGTATQAATDSGERFNLCNTQVLLEARWHGIRVAGIQFK
jgi:hypothetical protein